MQALETAHPQAGIDHGLSVDANALNHRDREASRLEVIDEALLVSRAAFDDLVAARTQAGRSFLEALQRDLVGALRVAQHVVMM